MRRGNAIALSAAAAAVLGTLAVAFSFIAYATRIKAEDVNISSDGYCIYPSSRAFGLGIVAALFLLIEQTVISAGTGCFCCAGSRCPSTCGGITAVIFFVISWLTFVIAFLGLISGALINSGSFLATAYPGNNKGNEGIVCYNINQDSNSSLFLGAAFWSILSIVLGLISYITFKLSRGNSNNQTGVNFANEQGIAMGQPSTQPK